MDGQRWLSNVGPWIHVRVRVGVRVLAMEGVGVGVEGKVRVLVCGKGNNRVGESIVGGGNVGSRRRGPLKDCSRR